MKRKVGNLYHMCIKAFKRRVVWTINKWVWFISNEMLL